jgi:cytochrome P450
MHSPQTVSALVTSVLALMMYPAAQARAQCEIDTVIGRERLPEYSDRASLPYVTALCREVFRWNPVAPLGLPRSSVRDEIYNGWLIPAGVLQSRFVFS